MLKEERNHNFLSVSWVKHNSYIFLELLLLKEQSMTVHSMAQCHGNGCNDDNVENGVKNLQFCITVKNRATPNVAQKS